MPLSKGTISTFILGRAFVADERKDRESDKIISFLPGSFGKYFLQKGVHYMISPFRRPALRLSLLACLLLFLSACSQASTLPAFPTTMTPTSEISYTLAGGGSCVRLGSDPQPPYANVRVSHDPYLAHSEPMLVENPDNPLNLVGGAKFFPSPANYLPLNGYFVSFDGGCTWKDGGIFPGFQQRYTLTSNVAFAFGRHHDVYAVVIFQGQGGMSGLAVSTSTNDGRTFSNPVNLFERPEDEVFSDKPWITVDRTNGPNRGDIYVVWSYEHGKGCSVGKSNSCVQEIAFSRSTDGGKTFSAPRMIEGSAPFCANSSTQSTRCDGGIGATPVVEPDGTLAVAFRDTFSNNAQGGQSIPNRLLIVTSSDGGKTWSAPVSIAAIRVADDYFPHEHYRNLTLPAFACDPKTGQLYIAWANLTSGDADILFSTSSDHGQTWSAPVRVNDDALGNGAEQFQPQMAVAPNGVLSISFFDTRIDPQHRLIDVFLAQSINHGVSFLPNVRVTTRSWDPAVDAPVNSSGSQFIGDYQGLAADNQFVHPFWNDTRTGLQEIFTVAVPSASET